MRETISWAGRSIPVLGSYDVIVCGGGSAGASAALSSSEGGLKTLIVEKSIRLGGSSVNALVTPMMNSYTGHHQNFYRLEKQLQEDGATRDIQGTQQRWYSAESMAYAWEKLVLQAGCSILYDAVITDVIKDHDSIQYLIVTTIEGVSAIRGKQFVDASGDAVVSRLAGAPVRRGDDDGNNQISSLRFEVGGIDIEEFRSYVFSTSDTYSIHRTKGDYFEAAMVGGKGFALQPLFDKGVEDGILIPDDLHYWQCYSVPGKPGVMSFNCPHLVHLPDNSSAMNRSIAITEGRASIHRLVRFMKKYLPGFEHSWLEQEASMLGVRESYEIVGKYVLNEDDYSRKARFDDAVARGDWYIDVHSAKKSLYHRVEYQKGDYYEIPYRSMISSSIRNLVTAGRCISTSFLMEASVRIIPTVIDMGEAAGTACVLAEKNHVQTADLDGTLVRKALGNYQ